MGQKVNPISLRLEKTNRHFDSCWYDDYNYTDLLLRDLKIKNYFKSVLNQIKYPEGRILIENLPKKSNINLFYCNPSNSKRKKTLFFQLQDYKEKKKNFYKKKPFSFPEQKYLYIEKSATFTLAQRTLEGWKNSITDSLYLYKKNVQCDGNKVEKGLKKQTRVTQVLHKNRLFYCLSDLIQTKKKIDTEKQFLPKKNWLFPPDQLFGKELLLRENKKKYQSKEYSKIKEIIDKKGYRGQPLYQKRDLCASKVVKIEDFKTPSFNQILRDKGLSILSKAHRNRSVILLGNNNINNFLLQFVLKKRENNKRVEEGANSMRLLKPFKIPDFNSGTLSKPFKISDFNRKQDTDKKWVVERFFVRFLLARLYGEFLQNKSVYSQENLRTLYQFRMFFQEKHKKQSIEERDSKKPISKKLPKYGSLSGKQDIGKNVQRKDNQPKSLTKYNNSFASKTKIVKKKGLYSSNLVYKSHLESFLSKQYNSFFNLHLFRTLMEMQGALFLVQEIIYYLERKIPFRRIKTQILKEIPRYKHIKGVRMSCSGRVGGRSKKAQRSKTQSVKIGQTPLGVFSSQIDFASKSALTRFGLIGVKVWVCYR